MWDFVLTDEQWCWYEQQYINVFMTCEIRGTIIKAIENKPNLPQQTCINKNSW